MVLLLITSAVALLLGLGGVYSVVAYVVSQHVSGYLESGERLDLIADGVQQALGEAVMTGYFIDVE